MLERPNAPFELREEIPISQELKLLPNFVSNMPIYWVQAAKFRFKLINVVVRKFVLSQRADNPQNVDQPSALFHGNLLKFP